VPNGRDGRGAGNDILPRGGKEGNNGVPGFDLRTRKKKRLNRILSFTVEKDESQTESLSMR